MAAMDFTSAATSVHINPAEVTQHLMMAGVSTETGIELKDMKIKANVTDESDTCVWAMLDE